jgi:septal ring factor EnvC (AmiA/AmiB activator)
MKIAGKILILLLALCFVPVQGQSRKQLEAKRKKMQEDIAYTRRILEKTRAKKSAALHNLNTLNVIIKEQTEVITGLKDEIQETDVEIAQRNQRLKELQEAFEQEKMRMRKTIVKAYKTRKNANEVAFVFASESFRQALRRLKYLKKLSEYRSFLIGRIEDSKDSVQSGLVALESTRQEKNVLLTDEQREKNALEKDKQDKSKVVKTLNQEEKQLRKKIRDNEANIAKLNSAISRMIAQEIEAARKKAEKEAKKSGGKTASSGKKEGSTKSSSSALTSTPEAKELSNNFASNKGALPWPVDKGYVSQTFGAHAHPDLAGITLVNNGVDITTAEGGTARAVFRGTVSAIINIPGQEKAVLINHGEYYTVYSRLSDVYVTKGQAVSAKTSLGKVWTDGDGKTVLQFQVWKGQEKQNPGSWLASK